VFQFEKFLPVLRQRNVFGNCIVVETSLSLDNGIALVSCQ